MKTFSDKQRELALRVASGFVLGPTALACVFIGGAAYQAAVILAGVWMAFEWRDMTSKKPVRETRIRPLFWAPIGLFYVSAAIAALLYLRTGELGFHRVLFLVACVWATDIAAYFTGRAVGGPKLAPRFSPKKTWSGYIGGATASALIACLLTYVLSLGISYEKAALWGAIIATAGQIGDLFESWVKRVFGFKDSGNLIPGHGGLLDRMDGMNAAAIPFVLFNPLLG